MSFRKEYTILIVLLMTGIIFCQTPLLYRGADLSSLPQIEAAGGEFDVGLGPEDILTILTASGFNLVRLRLWHSPADGHYGLEEVTQMCQRIHETGMAILLDFHFSDTWADPGHQTPPAVWEGLSSVALADSIYNYTYHVLDHLQNHDALPELVQIGNEINCGLLWDLGRVCGQYDTPEQWETLALFLNSAAAAVRSFSFPDGSTPEIIIHFADGGDYISSTWFFDSTIEYGVDYDHIGLSYYPWWHGSLSELAENLDILSLLYDRHVFVLETAYPWTLAWNDDTHNIIGTEEQLLPGFPASPSGQYTFLWHLLQTVASTSSSHGRCVCYWEPAWLSLPESGSALENLNLFDFEGQALPGLLVFAAGDLNEDGTISILDLVLMVDIILSNEEITPVFWRGDLNSDGELDVVDLVRLIMVILSD